jgi:hypothetical protein
MVDTARCNEFVGLPKHDIREQQQFDVRALGRLEHFLVQALQAQGHSLIHICLIEYPRDVIDLLAAFLGVGSPESEPAAS